MTEETLEHQELTDEEQALAKLKEAIQVKVEDIGKLRKKMTITVPQTMIEERRNEQFSEIKRDSVVPGFRRGHAPLKLIEKRFGTDVDGQLSSQLLSSSYLAAVEKEEIKTIGDPLIWAKDKKVDETEKLVSVEEAFDLMALPASGDFTYKCEVEVRPEFDLPKLEGIEIKQPKVEIGKEQIDAYVDRLRAMRGRYEPVLNEKAKEDDLILCKIRITSGEQVIVEEENAQLAARPQRYAGVLLDELGDVLKGAQVGDTRKTKGQLPDDFKDEALRSKTADVEIEIKDIKRLVLPEIDQEFLNTLGCENKQELENWVKSTLESYKNDETRHIMREQVYKHLLDNTEVELPQGLSQRQSDSIAARRMLDMSRRGVPETEIIKQADAIKTGAQKDAMNDLKIYFILEKVAEEWKIDVSEDEINAQIAAIAQRQNRRFDRVRDDLIRSKSMSSLYVHVRDEKIVDQIIEKSNISEAAEEKSEEKPKKAKSTGKKTTKKSKSDKDE